jgi:hypothetical protein
MILEASLVMDGVSKFWRLRRAPQNKDRPSAVNGKWKILHAESENAIRIFSDPLLQKAQRPPCKGGQNLCSGLAWASRPWLAHGRDARATH